MTQDAVYPARRDQQKHGDGIPCAVLSNDAVTMRDPVRAERPHCLPHPICPDGVNAQAPVLPINARGVVEGRGDNGHHPAETAATTQSVCPARMAIAVPLSASDRRAVLSSDAVTTREPSAAKTALFTASSCRKVAASAPVAVSEIAPCRLPRR